MIEETLVLYTLLPYICFPFLCRIKLCSGCFRQVFFIWETIKVVAGRVRQVVVLYSNNCMRIWLGGFSIGRLRQVDVYRGGRFNRFDCIYIYINYNLNPIKKLTSSSRSTKSKNILQWNISQMILKTIPISMKIFINYVMKRSILFWVYWKLMETETTTWSEFPKGGKAIAEQILASEEINSKDQDCEMQSGIRVGKLNFWVRSFEIIQSLPGQPVPPDRLASPYDGH